MFSLFLAPLIECIGRVKMMVGPCNEQDFTPSFESLVCRVWMSKCVGAASGIDGDIPMDGCLLSAPFAHGLGCDRYASPLGSYAV